MRSKRNYIFFPYINLILTSNSHPTGMIENSISVVFGSFLLFSMACPGSGNYRVKILEVVFSLLSSHVSRKILIVSVLVVPLDLVIQRECFR